MGLIQRTLNKLRGKGLRVVLYGLVTVGSLAVGLTLPEPTKQAIVGGSAIVIEALTAPDAPAAVEGE